MLSCLVCLIALLPLWSQVLGGEVPIVDGVWGGARFNASAGSTTTRVPVTSATIVPTSTTELNDTTLLPYPTFDPNRPPTGPIIAFWPHLRILENSGVCETTPGVYQASGYGDISPKASLWFWFFAARKNPDTAPLVLWFNGGPGSSSMIGLFQEHGPCRIKDDSSTVMPNPMSWNNEANVLYIDQPVGTGFSYGALEVDTSEKAAQDVWRFLQIFLADPRFSKYSTNPLAIWTESYGGHYGPVFAEFFLRQNEEIAAGRGRDSKTLNLKVLGIGNGMTDPLAQYPEYLSYAAQNPYHNDLVPMARISSAQSDLAICEQQIAACYAGGTATVCSEAQVFCNKWLLSPLAGVWDRLDIRYRFPAPYPPNFARYINDIRGSIGAAKPWEETNFDVYNNFVVTGDWMRNSRPALERIINAGIRTLIFAGDADYVCNYKGIEAMVGKLDTKFTTDYGKAVWTPYRVRGVETGVYKQVGTFAYLRVYGAGHLVPAYDYGGLGRGEAALQFFNQITFNRGLSST